MAPSACRSPGVAHGTQDGGDHPQRPVLLEQIGIDQVLRHALAIGGRESPTLHDLTPSSHLASFSDGWYFAGVSHTTLGYGDVVLSKPWRSLGPICAINGLLTFGCSTAFLFLVLQMIWQHPL